MKVAVLSNTNVGLLAGQLASRHEVFEAPGFGAWAQELVNPASAMFAFQPSAIFLLVDGHELVKVADTSGAMLDELDQHLHLFEEAAATHPQISFFVANLDLHPRRLSALKAPSSERALEQHWQRALDDLSERLPNVAVFDFKGLVETFGRRELYSDKMWYLGAQKYSMGGLGVLSAEIERCLRALAGQRKKVLVVDLDNTLWGKVVGEEGPLGVELAENGAGARFKDFQRRVKNLKELGVVLALCSKNNEADAQEVFDDNPHMVLTDDDFSARKINWQEKSLNLEELASELGLGIDSFVFIDDSPFEREAVREALPGVVVADFPKDTARLPALVDDLYREHFTVMTLTQEDLNKTRMYRDNARRNVDQKRAGSLEDFLRTLGSKVRIESFGAAHFERVHQLIQKTNQFNLTTRRHDRQALTALSGQPATYILVVSVADKYGDNGIVGVIIWTEHTADRSADLDTLLMSCRVMGRHLEDQLIAFVEDTLRDHGIQTFYTTYVPTQKNQPVAGLFDSLGYSLVGGEDGTRRYVLDLGRSCERKAFAEILDHRSDP